MTSTPEIEHRLATIRRIASSARNGHPESITELANEILILDAQIVGGAELPEAWQPCAHEGGTETTLREGIFRETCADCWEVLTTYPATGLNPDVIRRVGSTDLPRS